MTDLQRDLEDKIKAHPIIAVAIALGAGALIALVKGSSSKAAPAKKSASSVVIGGLGAIAMGMIRTAVIEHLSVAAKGWLEMDRERPASPERSVESFLEH